MANGTSLQVAQPQQPDNVNDGKVLDFNALFVGQGLSLAEIYTLSSKHGLPVAWSDQQSFIDKTPGLAEQVKIDPIGFNKLWSASEAAYKLYQADQFDKSPYRDDGTLMFPFVERMGKYPIAVHMIGGEKAGRTNVLGMEGVSNLGFVKTRTEDQEAALVGSYIDKNGSWKPLSLSKYADNYLVWEKGDGINTPEYFYRELGDTEWSNPEKVRTWLGDRSVWSGSNMGSFLRGFQSAVVAKTVRGAGSLVEFFGDIVDPSNQEKWSDDIGRRTSLFAAHATHQNEDERVGAFNNSNSFWFGMGDGMGQLTTVLASAYAAGGAGLAAGMGRKMANKLAQNFSVTLAASQKAALSREEMKKLGIPEDVSAMAYIPFFLATMFSENMIGPNVLTAPLSMEGKKLIAESIKKWFGSEGIKKLPKDQLKKKGKDMWKEIATKIEEAPNKYVLAAIPLAGGEEYLEEGFEGMMDYGTESIMNGLSLELAYDTKGTWKDWEFVPMVDQKTGKKYYSAVHPLGEVKDISVEEYEDIQKDLSNSDQTIRQGGVYSNLDAWTGFKEEGVMAFLSAAPMGAMTHYINRQKNLEKDMTLAQYAFAEYSNPKLRKSLLESLEELSNSGEVPEKFLLPDGKPVVFGSGEASRFDVYKKSLIDNIDAYKGIIDRYKLSSPAFIDKNGGNQSLINKAVITLNEIENAQKEIISINQKEVKTPDDNARITKLTEDINRKQIETDEIMTVENPTKYSPAYNNLVKRISAPIAESEELISGLLYGGRKIDDADRKTVKYQNAMNATFPLANKANYDNALEFSSLFEKRKVEYEKEIATKVEARKTLVPEISSMFKGLSERLQMPGLPVEQAIGSTINTLETVIKKGLDFSSAELADSYKSMMEKFSPIRKQVDDLSQEYFDLKETKEQKVRDLSPEEDNRLSELSKMYDVTSEMLEDFDVKDAMVRTALQSTEGTEPARMTEDELFNDFYTHDIESIVSKLERAATLPVGKVYQPGESVVPSGEPFAAMNLKEVEDDLKKAVDLHKRRDGIAFTNNIVLNAENVKDHVVKPKDRPLTDQDYEGEPNGVLPRLERLRSRIGTLSQALSEIGVNKLAYQDRYRYEILELNRLSIKHFLDRVDDFDEEKSLLARINKIDIKKRVRNSVMSPEEHKEWTTQMRIINQIESNLYDKIDTVLTDKKLEELITSFYTKRVFRYTEDLDHTSINYIDDMNEIHDALIGNLIGYVHFVNWLERIGSAKSNDIYTARQQLYKNWSGKLSTFEQQQAENQVLAFMINSGSKYLSRIYEIEQRAKETKEGQKISTDNYFISNSIILRGDYATGKTDHVMPMVFRLHEIMTGKESKITAIHMTNNLRVLMEKSLKGFNVDYLSTNKIFNESASIGGDFVVWDEASTINESQFSKIKNGIKNKPVIFLGDKSQMFPLDRKPKFAAVELLGLKTIPLTVQFLKELPILQDIANWYKEHIFPGVSGFIQLPKAYAEGHDENNNLTTDFDKIVNNFEGAHYFATPADVINAYIKSKSDSKALILVDLDQFNELQKKDPEFTKSQEANIFILAPDLERVVKPGEPNNVMGLRRNEIYIPVDIVNLQSIPRFKDASSTLPGRVGYTAVGRAEKFVALVDNVNRNTVDKSQVKWRVGSLENNRYIAEQLNRLNGELTDITISGLKSSVPTVTTEPMVEESMPRFFHITRESKGKKYDKAYFFHDKMWHEYDLDEHKILNRIISSKTAKKYWDEVKEGYKPHKKIPQKGRFYVPREGEVFTYPTKGEFRYFQTTGEPNYVKGTITGQLYKDPKGVPVKYSITMSFGSLVPISIGEATTKEDESKTTVKEVKKQEEIIVSTGKETNMDRFSRAGLIYSKHNALGGSGYTVRHDKERNLTEDEIKQVRTIRPLLEQNLNYFTIRVEYHKDVILTNESNVPTPYHHQLLVKLEPRPEFARWIEGMESKVDNKLIKSAIQDIVKNGLTDKYAYISALADTEYDYIINGKQSLIKDLGYDYADEKDFMKILDLFNDNTKFAIGSPMINGSNKDLNKTKAILRRIGEKRAENGVYRFNGELKPISSELTKKYEHGMVVYKIGGSGQRGIVFIKEQQDRGMKFGPDFIQVKTEDGRTVVIKRFNWIEDFDYNSPDFPYVIFHAPLLSTVQNLSKFKDQDMALMSEVKKGDSSKFNSRFRQTFLYNLVMNNKAIISGLNDVGIFLGEFFVKGDEDFKTLDVNMEGYYAQEEKKKYKGEPKGFYADVKKTVFKQAWKDIMDNLTEGSLHGVILNMMNNLYLPLGIEKTSAQPIIPWVDEADLVTDAIDIHVPYLNFNIDDLTSFYQDEISKYKSKDTLMSSNKVATDPGLGRIIVPDDDENSDDDEVDNKYGKKDFMISNLSDDGGTTNYKYSFDSQNSFQKSSQYWTDWEEWSENIFDKPVDKKVNYYNLHEYFGRYETVNDIRRQIAYQIGQKSHFGVGADFNPVPVEDAIKTVQSAFVNLDKFNYGVINTHLNKPIGAITVDDLPSLSTNEKADYFNYKLADPKLRIFEAIVNSIFPSYNFKRGKFIKYGQDSIQTDHDKVDPELYKGDVMNWQLMITELNQYQFSPTGEIVKVRAFNSQKPKFINVNDLARSLKEAGVEAKKKLKRNPNLNYNDTFFNELMKIARGSKAINFKSNNILSFIERFHGITLSKDSVTSTTVSLREIAESFSNRGEIGRARARDINNLLTSIINFNKSLIRKIQMDINITGYGNSLAYNLRTLEENTEDDIKNQFQNDIIRRVFYPGTENIHNDVRIGLKGERNGKGRQYEVTEDAIYYVGDGGRTAILMYRDNKWMVSDLIDRRERMLHMKSFLGLSKMREDAFMNLLNNEIPAVRDNLANRITGINVNSSTLGEDLIAEGFANMFFSLESHLDISTRLSDINSAIDEDMSLIDIEVENGILSKEEAKVKRTEIKKERKQKESEARKNLLYDNQMLSFKRKLGILEENLDGITTMMRYDDVEEIEHDDYHLPNPTDFYQFLIALGVSEAYHRGEDWNRWSSDLAGNIRYNFELSSELKERFAYGSGIIKNLIKDTITNNSDLINNSAFFGFNKTGAIEGYNILVDPGSKAEIIRLIDLTSISHFKATDDPNESDLNNMYLAAFEQSVQRIKGGKSLEKLYLPVDNISDTGRKFLVEFTFDNSGTVHLFEKISRKPTGEIDEVVINDNLILRAVWKEFQHRARVAELSRNRIVKVLGRSVPFSEEYKTNNGKLIERAEKELRKNVDYVIDNDGFLRLGSATLFNAQIYNEKNWKAIQSEWNVSVMNKLFEDEYKNFATKLSHLRYKPLAWTKDIFATDDFVYYRTHDGKRDGNIVAWNPFYRAFFFASEIAMQSMSPLVFGDQSHFKNITEQSKYAGPANTGGNFLDTDTKEGLGKTSKVIYVKDLYDTNPELKKKYKLSDGGNIGNPLWEYSFMQSLGGPYAPIDKTMVKSLYNYVDLITGDKTLHKEAVDFITGDTLGKSLALRNAFKVMLDHQSKLMNSELGRKDIDVYNTWKTYYNENNDFERSIQKTALYYINNNELRDSYKRNLVWKLANESSVKGSITKLNSFDIRNDKDIDPISADVYNDHVKVVLNPFQDIYDPSKLTPAAQILAYAGVGNNVNRLAGTKINSLMTELFLIAKEEIDAEISEMIIASGLRGEERRLAQYEEYLRNIGIQALNKMGQVGNYAELITNRQITIGLPPLRMKLLQAYRNLVTHRAIKTKFAGLRANQSTGDYFDLFDKDGITYTLDEVERDLKTEITFDNVNTLSSKGYTRRKMKAMRRGKDGNDPGEMGIPFSYMERFGVRKNETVNDLFTIVLNDGTRINTIKMTIDEQMDTMAKNLPSIDFSATPMVRQFKELENVKEGTYNLSNVRTWLTSVGDVLHAFSTRVPSHGLQSSYYGNVIFFVNDNGNMVYMPSEQTVYDDTDFDIDQRSVYFYNLTEDNQVNRNLGTVGGIQNAILDELRDIYLNKANSDNIFISSEVTALEKVVEDTPRDDRFLRPHSYAARLEMYGVSKTGSDAISILARSLTTVAYLAQLGRGGVSIASGFSKMFNNLDISGKNSLISREGDWLQSALDNVKKVILGRFGITLSAVPIVPVLVAEGFTNEQIHEFFKHPAIRSVFYDVESGQSIGGRVRDHLLLDVIDKDLQLHQPLTKKDKKEFTKEVENYNKQIKLIIKEHPYWDKNEELQRQVHDLELLRNKLEESMFSADSYDKLIQLKDIATKSEALRRLGEFINMYNGIIATDFEHERFLFNAQKYMGMTLDEYKKGKDWNLDDHLKYYMINSSDYAFLDGDKDHPLAAQIIPEMNRLRDNEALIAGHINIPSVLRSLGRVPATDYTGEIKGRFDSYLGEYIEQKERHSKIFLIDNPVFYEKFAKPYLYGQNRTWFDFKNLYYEYQHVLGEYFLDYHWKLNYSDDHFDLSYPEYIDGKWSKKALTKLDGLNLNNGHDRGVFLLQFPYFIDHITNISKLKEDEFEKYVKDVNDNIAGFTGDEIKKLRNNDFLDRLQLIGRTGLQFMGLRDSFGLSDNDMTRLSTAFKRLPRKLQELFIANNFIALGFRWKKGSIQDIMGPSFYYGEKGLSGSLDELKQRLNDQKYSDTILTDVGRNFKEYLETRQGMARSIRRDEILEKKTKMPDAISANRLVAGLYWVKSVKRWNPRLNDFQYVYAVVNRGGFDTGIEMTTTRMEPIRNLTASELDEIMTLDETIGRVRKTYFRRHGYNTNDLYITETGDIVRAVVISPTIVDFYKDATDLATREREQKETASLEVRKKKSRKKKLYQVKYLGVEKIVTNGYSGVASGGLNAGKVLYIPTGGVAAKGYITDNGSNPGLENLGLEQNNIDDKEDAWRSAIDENMRRSSGTLIIGKDLSNEQIDYAINLTKKYGKPKIINPSSEKAFKKWITDNNITILNIVGNTEKDDLGSSKRTEDLIVKSLSPYAEKQAKEIPYDIKLTNKSKLSDLNLSIDLFNALNAQKVDADTALKIIMRMSEVMPGLPIISESDLSVEFKDKDLNAWVDEKGIHINIDRIRYDSGLHELQHVWNKILQVRNPELYKRMENMTKEWISANPGIIKAVKSKYRKYGQVLEGGRLEDEMMAILGGFHTYRRIMDWSVKNNIGDRNFALRTWDFIKELAREIVEAIRSLFGYSKTSNIGQLDLANASLGDLFAALADDFIEGNEIINFDDETNMKIFLSAYGERKDANIPLREPVKNTKHIVPYFNNNTTDHISLDQLDEEHHARAISNTMRSKVTGGKLKYKVGSVTYEYDSSISDDQLKYNIHEYIIPAINKIDENLTDQVKNFINLYKEGKSIKQAGIDAFDGRYSYAVLRDFAHAIGLYDSVIDVMRYSELQHHKNPNLSKLYNPAFSGYDPFVILHGIDKNGVVDISLVDITTKSLGRRYLELEGHHLTSTFQSVGDYNDVEGNMGNSDGEIRNIILGMTIMNMRKITDNKVRFRNIGSVGLHTRRVIPFLIADLRKLLHNVNIVRNIPAFMNVIESQDIKDTLNDDKLYDGDYLQSWITRIITYLRDIQYDKTGPFADTAKAQHDFLIDPNIDNEQRLAIFKKMQMDFEKWHGTGWKNSAAYYEAQMIANAIRQLQSGRAGFVNELRDMAYLERWSQNPFDVHNEVLQYVFYNGELAKSITINKFRNDFLESFLPLAKAMVEQYFNKPGNASKRGKSRIADIGSDYFNHLFKKLEIKDSNGEKQTTILPEIHWSLEDKETKRLYDAGELTKLDLEFSNFLLDKLEERWIDNIFHTMKRNPANIDAKGEIKITKEEARKQFWEEYEGRGHVPVIGKSVNELILSGKKNNIDEGIKKFGLQLANYENLFADAIGRNSDLDEMGNQLNKHRFEEERLKAAGLYRDNNGDIRLNSKYENDVMSTNLVDMGFYFMLGGIRKEVYEDEFLPAYNNGQAMLTYMEGVLGQDESLYNTKKFLDLYVNRLAFRKTADDHKQIQIGKVKVETTQLMRGLLRGYSLGMLAFRPVIAAKSEVFNDLASIMTALGTGLSNVGTDEDSAFLPGPKDLFRAHKSFLTDFRKMRRLALDLQIIEPMERDLLDNIFINPTSRNLGTENMGHMGNRATDYKIRMIGMAAWMMMEGSWDAYSYDDKSGKIVYNETQDLRFYTQDGKKKTEKGEQVILQHIKNNLQKQGVNKPMGHDFVLANQTLKWYGDKYLVGGFTEIDKPLATMTWAGSAISMFRLFSFPRLFNMGFFAKTRQVSYGKGYKAVKDDSGEWVAEKDMLEIEGAWQSLSASMKALRNIKRENFAEWWSKQSPVRRYNVMKSAIQVAIFSIIVGMLKAFGDEDDEARFAWLKRDVLLLLAAEDFLESPIPALDAITNLSKISGADALLSIGPLRDVRALKDRVSEMVEE